jgi:hypothetical protein
LIWIPRQVCSSSRSHTWTAGSVRPHIRSEVRGPLSGFHPSWAGASVDSPSALRGGIESRSLASVEANPVTTASCHGALAGSFCGLKTFSFPGPLRARDGFSSLPFAKPKMRSQSTDTASLLPGYCVRCRERPS